MSRRPQAQATVERASYLQNDAFCFDGTQIPQQGPEGTRGDTLTQDRRKGPGAFFQLTVVGTNGNDGQLYSHLKGDIPGVQAEVARRFAVAVAASSAELRRAAGARASSRFVFVPLEDENATSVTGGPRAAPFAEAARAATSGAVALPLLKGLLPQGG